MTNSNITMKLSTVRNENMKALALLSWRDGFLCINGGKINQSLRDESQYCQLTTDRNYPKQDKTLGAADFIPNARNCWKMLKDMAMSLYGQAETDAENKLVNDIGDLTAPDMARMGFNDLGIEICEDRCSSFSVDFSVYSKKSGLEYKGFSVMLRKNGSWSVEMPKMMWPKKVAEGAEPEFGEMDLVYFNNFLAEGLFKNAAVLMFKDKILQAAKEAANKPSVPANERPRQQTQRQNNERQADMADAMKA